MDALPTQEPTDQILDAAISILAMRGVAALTHTAVDDELGWARGTTASHYAGTQRELLDAAAHRMVFLDALDFAGFKASAAGITAVVERTFRPESRKRFMARLELFLYAARTSDFATMHWARDLFAAGAEGHMRIAGARMPRLAAEAVIALVEGLSLHDFVSPRMVHKDRFALIRRAVSGFLEEAKNPHRL
jgi:DNA-binding transcriptional regulator YbjK